jgi:hypothetical protein
LDANPEADDYLHNPDPKRDRKVGPSVRSRALPLFHSFDATK